MDKFTPQMTIRETLDISDNAAGVFQSFGMHCLSCPAATAETIEEACQVHGIDVNEMLSKLNELLMA